MPRKSEPTMCNRVRELRAAHGDTTQQELADEVAVTRQTIVALEAGAYTAVARACPPHRPILRQTRRKNLLASIAPLHRLESPRSKIRRSNMAKKMVEPGRELV